MIDAIIFGLALGSIYAMLALAFVLIYAATGVGSFAQGAFAALAAMSAYVFNTRMGIEVWLAIVMGLAVATTLSSLIYIVAIRRLDSTHHLFRSMVTLALSIIIEGVVELWGGGNTYQFPRYLPDVVVHIGGVSLPITYVCIGAVVLVTACALDLMLRKAKTGVVVRAITQRPEAAKIMGVNLPRVLALVWAAGGLIAGIGGILAAPLIYTSYNMLDTYLIATFASCALGGLGSIWGAVLGGLLVGVLEGIIGQYVPATMLEAVALGVLIVVFALRPQGMFGSGSTRAV